LKISSDGIKLIKEFEGLKLHAYLCPAEVWTIGYGSTTGVKEGMCIDSATAEALLLRDLAPIEKALIARYNLTQAMFDALAAFSFNVGMGWMKRSGLKDALDRKDFKEAANQLLRWNKAGGKVLPGLTRRRSAERDLFMRGYTRLLEL
jgi:lysozyme